MIYLSEQTTVIELLSRLHLAFFEGFLNVDEVLIVLVKSDV